MSSAALQPKSDPQRLRRLIGLHAVANPRIIDTTYGHGGFWRGLPYNPIRLDVRDLPGVDYIAAWSDLPQLFLPHSLDVAVWDPIHVTDVGAGSVMGKRYAAEAAPVVGPDITSLYAPFLESVRQVLVPLTGICIVKLADQVHGQRQRLHFVDFVIAAREQGWTVCDYDIGMRPNSIVDPKWIRELHVRKSWAFWVVVRNGRSCEGPGRARMNVCPGCGFAFKSARGHARTCSARCRVRVWRAAQRVTLSEAARERKV